MWDTCTSHSGPKKFDRVGRRGQGRSKYGTFGSFQWEMCTNALFWPSLTPPANPVKFFWSKMVCTGVPHIVLHVSCQTRTSGGIFGPLKSDLGVFWPFRGTDFIMGKNKNANFSKSPHGPIFKFFVVIPEVILQKNGTNLSTGEFFFGFDPYRPLCLPSPKPRPSTIIPSTTDGIG